MLASQFRFHGYGSLNYVYRNGKTVRQGPLSLRFVTNTRRTRSRVAIVVSKKVAKKAVERNRIRRRLYEATRLKLPNIKAPHDIVITVFDKQLLQFSADDIDQIITKIFTKAQLI